MSCAAFCAVPSVMDVSLGIFGASSLPPFADKVISMYGEHYTELVEKKEFIDKGHRYGGNKLPPDPFPGYGSAE